MGFLIRELRCKICSAIGELYLPSMVAMGHCVGIRNYADKLYISNIPE